MASTFTTRLRLEKQATGENANTWGDKTNTNLQLVEQAVGGYEEVSIAGGAGTTALTIDSSGNVTSPVSIGNAGSIIQTVSATSSTAVVLSTATTWTNVNPTVAITPKFSSSKILVIHSGSMMSQAQGGNIQMRLIRDSSTIAHFGRMYTDLENSDWQSWAMTWPYIDSPSTTSEVGYQFQIYLGSTNGALRHNQTVSNTPTAATIAMEIKQ